jgi:hypothetical protein
MQTAILDRTSDTGWAGRMADKVQAAYGGNFPIIISLAGTNIFCEGVVAESIQSNGNPTQLLNGTMEGPNRMPASPRCKACSLSIRG